MTQALADADLMRDELARKRARGYWIMGALFLVVLLFIAARIILRLLPD